MQGLRLKVSGSIRTQSCSLFSRPQPGCEHPIPEMPDSPTPQRPTDTVATHYDDIIVGSGLSATGALLGLDPGKRVLMLAGEPVGRYHYYNDSNTGPCASTACGGLGNDWHGVIPLATAATFGGYSRAQYIELFRRFYPRVDIDSLMGESLLFVPWKPIRPLSVLAEQALSRDRDHLRIEHQQAERFEARHGKVFVWTSRQECVSAQRLWLGAGPLHTPRLLERSLQTPLARGSVSDHVLCYMGLTRSPEPPEVRRSADGLLFPATYHPDGTALFTLRPARFNFTQLDAGIAQRAAFGMPTGRAIAKLLRRLSPGLLAEALYNRFGLFPAATHYSVYSQSRVADVYTLAPGAPYPLQPETRKIIENHQALDATIPWPGVARSAKPELYIPGIHLHHSVDTHALEQCGINTDQAPIQVIDASVVQDIGPDHHSFKIMTRAYAKACLTN